MIDNIETQLLAAGWSTVSGHLTANLLMQTATTPGTGQGLNGRFRFKDNGGNCVVVSVESTNGSRVHVSDANNGGMLLPGTAKTFRVIACPYQFFVFSQSALTAREFVCGGVPYIPSNLQGAIWECIWMESNAYNDTSTALPVSFRTGLHSLGNFQTLANGQMASQSSNTSAYVNPGQVGLVVPGAAMLAVQGSVFGNNAHRYHNDDLLLGDPLVYWGITGAADEGKIRGQLWDCLILTEYLQADSLYAINGHDMFVITHQNYGSSSSARGALVVAVN